jgi:hypothetical protein
MKAEQAAILDRTLPKVCHLAASNAGITLQTGATSNPVQAAGSEGEQAMETGRCN